MSEKCDEAVLVDSLKINWVEAAWGFMANDRIIMRCDYNVSCIDISGYVTAGNSRLARECQTSVGTHHSHLHSRIDETKHVETCILVYR